MDTNILLYSLNADAAEQASARVFLDEQQDNQEFVLSELVLVELYVLLRNPAVLRAPLSAGDSVAIIQQMRDHPSWTIVDHEPEVMEQVWRLAAQPAFARGRIFDTRLALSLQRQGVTQFATRNVRHFEGLGFERVWDPLPQR